VSPKLAPLMGGLPGVHGVYARGEPLAATEFHCPLLSLPLAFRTTLDTVPAPIPYLSANPAAVAAWRARLPQDDSLLVGVSWRGNPRHAEDQQRSIPMEVFAPLLSQGHGIRFVSLQKELTAKERGITGALPQFIHPGGDFGSTANLVGALDLVITVDSAWAHWAGAIGKPLWILLPFTPHWTWLTEREDSPWYPTARLFRQSQIGDWSGVMRRTGKALAQLRAGMKARKRKG